MIKPDTQKILFESLQDLLQSEDYSSITVTDIIRHCGASRSVFYKYFPDKYSLAVWPSEQYMAYVHQGVMNGTIPTEEQATEMRMQHYYDHRDYYEKIVTYRGQNSLEESIRICLQHNWQETLAHKMHVQELDESLKKSIHYHCQAQAAMITDWIRSGFPVDAKTFSMEMLADAGNIREQNLL